MAARKMTFTVPESTAARFLQVVAPSRRSHFVSSAIQAQLDLREKQLIAACEAVNKDKEIEGLITDWQAVNDPIEEPWDGPA